MPLMPQQRAISGLKSVGVVCLLALYLLHWPGAYLNDTMRWTLFGVMALTIGVAAWERAGQPRLFKWRWPSFTGAKAPAQVAYWWLAAIALVLFFGGYAILRTLEPNYFNQDDNFAQFGPILLAGVKSLLNKGIFPNWNPYQFMGSPVADVGTYALTYPLTYLAAWLAMSVFHSPALWADLFFILHAVPALLVLLHVLRLLKVTPALSLAATLAFLFCGYNLIAGRSWFYMMPLSLTLPLLAWLLIQLESFASKRWLWTAALTAGISFHAGNTQMWFYWVLFLGLGILARLRLSPELPRKAIIGRSFCALFMGLGLALPLLLPQLEFISTVERFPWGLGHIADNLWSLVIPYPFLEATYPSNFQGADTRIGQLYYASSVFTLVALALSLRVYVGWLRKRDLPLDKTTRLFLLLGWVAFALCLGEFGIIWRVLSVFPPFSLFSHPFKLILYLHFFSIVAAAHYLSHVRVRWDRALAGVSLLLTAYHLSQCSRALYVYGDRDYTALPPEIYRGIRENAGDADYIRVDNSAPRRNPRAGYVHSLTHNYATMYEIAGTWGYDPLVQYADGTRELFRRWEQTRCGEGEVIYPPFKTRKIFRCNRTDSGNPEELENLLRRTGTSSRLVFTREEPPVQVRPVTNPDPIVFAEGDPAKPYGYAVDFSGVSVENSHPKSAKPLVINFTWRKLFVAEADGRPVALSKDQWGRMIAFPPAEWKHLTLRYQPHWMMAGGLGLLCFLFGLAASVATRKFR